MIPLTVGRDSTRTQSAIRFCIVGPVGRLGSRKAGTLVRFQHDAPVMNTEWYEKYLDFSQTFVAGTILLLYVVGLAGFVYTFIGLG